MVKIMTRSITSTDVNIPSNDINNPIQTREISSTTIPIQPIFQSVTHLTQNAKRVKKTCKDRLLEVQLLFKL